MITLYTHGTPNGVKIAIALEEMNLAYKVKLVDIFAGETLTPEFKAMNPAGKIPVIQDSDTGDTVYESNAILMYLAKKSGKLLPPANAPAHKLDQLLFLQASLQGPMFGQRAHFSMFGPEHVPYAISRYEEQGAIIDDLMDELLSGHDYLMGDMMTIADISFYGWYVFARRSDFVPSKCKNLVTWCNRMAAREGVIKGLAATPTNPLPERRVA